MKNLIIIVFLAGFIGCKGSGGSVATPAASPAASPAVSPAASAVVALAANQVVASTRQLNGDYVTIGIPPYPSVNCIVARYSSNGVLDSTFNGGVGYTALPNNLVAIAVQTNDKIIVAGTDWSNSMGHGFKLIRLNSNGTLDTTFGVGGTITTNFAGYNGTNGQAIGGSSSLVVQPADDKIIVVGYGFTDGNNTQNSLIARYNADGSLDTTFNGSGKYATASTTWSSFYAGINLQNNNKILVSGKDNTNKITITRFNTDGTLDGSFGASGKKVTALVGWSDMVQEQSDGTIIASGHIIIGNYNMFAMKLLSDGTYDTTFNGVGYISLPTGVNTSVAPLFAIQPDGKIILGGTSNVASSGNIVGHSNQTLIRLTPNGIVDTTFGNAGTKIYDYGYTSGFASIYTTASDIVLLGSSTAITNTSPTTFDFITLAQ